MFLVFRFPIKQKILLHSYLFVSVLTPDAICLILFFKLQSSVARNVFAKSNPSTPDPAHWLFNLPRKGSCCRGQRPL